MELYEVIGKEVKEQIHSIFRLMNFNALEERGHPPTLRDRSAILFNPEEA